MNDIDDIHTESRKNRDFLLKKKSEILSSTRTEIDDLYDLINADPKNIEQLVHILNTTLITSSAEEKQDVSDNKISKSSK